MPPPTFFVAQAYNQADCLPPIGRALAAQNRLMAGALVDYDVRDQAKVEDVARSRAPLDPLLADTGWRLERPKIDGKATASWIRRKAPTTRGEWTRFVDEAITAQRALGTDYLVVPGVEIHGAHRIDQLQRQVAAARSAYSARLAQDPDWLMRVCVHDEWIRDSQQRISLLDELSDLPDAFGVALHVRWGRRNVAIDRDSLEALSVVVRALARDDRDVFLLRSGVIGWLATAWGAAGWSAGLAKGSWSDEGRVPSRRAKGSTNKKWFFEHSLLQWVEDADHKRLAADAGYKSCKCSFCNQLTSGASWTPAAPQHALYALARLADKTAAATAADRAKAVRGALRRAQTDWSNCNAGQILRTRAQAAPHLDLWQSLV